MHYLLSRRIRVACLSMVLAAASALSLHASANPWFQTCSDGNRSSFKSGFHNLAAIKSDRDGNFAQMLTIQPGETCAKSGFSKEPFGFGYGRIQYQGGTERQRHARLVESPDGSQKKVLDFTLIQPNVNHGEKGRIQMSVYGSRNVRIMNAKMRVYLSPAMETLRNYPNVINWLTLAEWWNNDNWSDDPHPFRISVNLVKPTAQVNSPLVFRITSETFNYKLNKWNTVVWNVQADHFNVPTGQWITLEYALQEGDRSSGRFVMQASTSDGKIISIADVRNFTRHPFDPKPDGFGDINPIKLYSSGDLIRYATKKNAPISVLWDDLELNACKSWSDCALNSAPTPPGFTSVKTVR